MRDKFDGAIFEGMLLGGATKSRGSLFGTAFGQSHIPIYVPAQKTPQEETEDQDDHPSP